MTGSTVQPWLGPNHYTEDQAAQFHGRSSQQQEIERLVHRDTLTVLYGASGLGKTSLLLAGLFPRLRATGYLPVHVRLQHGAQMPLAQQLLVALAGEAKKQGIDAPSVPDNESLWEHFHRAGQFYWGSGHRVVTPVLVIDQFEELFTLGHADLERSAASREFVRQLADLIEDRAPDEVRAQMKEQEADLLELGFGPRAPHKILLSLREDFLAPLEQLRSVLPSMLGNRMRLLPLTVQQARQVIESPEGASEILADGVTNAIIEFVASSERSVGTSIFPPPVDSQDARADSSDAAVDPALLSIFCFELNRRRIDEQKKQIDRSLLQGSKEDILLSFYDRAFRGLSRAAQCFVEDELVSPAGFRDSRSIDHAAAQGVTSGDLERLVNRRLLRFEDRGVGPRRVELSHDVFLKVAQRRRERRLRRRQVWQRLSWGAALAIMVAGPVAFIIYGYLFLWKSTQYYGDIVERSGEPYGIGELTEDEVKHRVSSFRIVRRGRWGHVNRLEAIGYDGRPSVYHGAGTHVFHSGQRSALGGQKISRRRTEVAWSFRYDESGELVSEQALAADGKVVWTFLYSPSVVQENGNSVRYGRYVTEQGVVVPGLHGLVRIESDASTGNDISAIRMNARREVIPSLDRAFGQVYKHDERGRIVHVTSLSPQGTPMMDAEGIAQLEVRYDERDRAIRSTGYDAVGRQTHFKAGHGFFTSTYDAQGRKRTAAYFAHDQTPVSVDGFHRMQWEYDDRGLLTTESYFDTDGHPTHDQFGCDQYRMKYDARGHRESLTCFVQGKADYRSDGVAEFRYQNDEWGDSTEVAYFGPAGELVSGSDGYHKETITRDQEGRVARVEYWLSDGKPAVSDGYSAQMHEHDDQTLKKTTRYLGPDGKPATHVDGYSAVVRRFDEGGREIEVSYLDISDAPTLHDDGYAGYRIQYSTHGYEERRVFFGLDGTVVASVDGYAEVRSEHNQRGDLVRETYFDEHGEPIRSDQNVAGLAYEYDDWGHLVAGQFLDEQGRLLAHKDGYCQWNNVFDRFGRVERTEYLDCEGSRAGVASGVAGWSYEYDDWGNELLEQAIGLDSKLTVNDQRYSQLRKTYDRYGNVVEEESLDPSDAPIAGTDGCALKRRGFDPRGRVVREECFDPKKQPTLSADGWHRTLRTHGDHGVTSEAYFDAQGNPIFSSDRYHRVQLMYNDYGQVVEVRYLDGKGSPILSKEGIASIRRKYVSVNVLSEESFYGKDGEPVMVYPQRAHMVRFETDKLGREVGRAFFDEEGKPTKSKDGYHRLRVKLDSHGRTVSEEYFGVDDTPTNSQFGFARVEAQFTDDGRIAEKRYFDARGAPTRSTWGVARRVWTYEKDGSQRIERLDQFDERGRKTLALIDTDEPETRFASQTSVFDANNRLIKVNYTDAQGRPVAQGDGCVARSFEYDNWGNRSSVACYAAGDEPTFSSQGCHKMVYKRNQWGHETDRLCLGMSDELKSHVEGWAQQKNEFNELGLMVETKYLDADDALIALSGIARITAKYSEQSGEIISTRYFDAKNEPVETPYHEVRYDYDSMGRLSKQEFFDKAGSPTKVNVDGQRCAVVIFEYSPMGEREQSCRSASLNN